MLVSDWSGGIRPASNVEALYRSWETRYWALRQGKGRSGLPYRDEDENKPASFKIPPLRGGFRLPPFMGCVDRHCGTCSWAD